MRLTGPTLLALVLLCATFILAGFSPDSSPGRPASLASTSHRYQHEESLYHFEIDSLASDLYQIRYQSDDDSRPRALTLPYPVYRFATGDLDRDGLLDLFVGVFKSCQFDPVPRRRLFIYTLEQGYLRSKWMGTYMPNDLLDFHVVENAESTRVHTLEKNEDQLYTGIYAWGSFGPRTVSYATESSNEDELRARFQRTGTQRTAAQSEHEWLRQAGKE